MDLRSALASFPAPSPVSAATVHTEMWNQNTRLIVLDDDPTGTQSVSDLPVLTRWDEDDFDWALALDTGAVYVLTNTRSVDAEEATVRNRQIVTNAVASAARLGISISFVSRSDSTLRGHYPLETDIIAETLAETTGERIDAVVIVPAFPDAGRLTIGGVHYMLEGEILTPIAETEFARDASFGYRNSRLADWVEEKSDGRRAARDVIVLDLGIIRRGPNAIADHLGAALTGATDSTPIVCDAASEDDLRLLSLGLIESESRGKKFLHRVGPPFVRARIGQQVRVALTADEIFADLGKESETDAAASRTRGGLIVVGSHVGVTSRQLAHLLAARPDAQKVEIDVERVLDSATAPIYVGEIVDIVAAHLRDADVILSTSRVLKRSDDAAQSLEISRHVSAAVVEIVQQTIARHLPRFVIAKGGITSSDVAAFGLGIRHAIVRGPMLPGIVSLWEPMDGPAQGVPYIVFAGNVGSDDSLTAVTQKLSSHSSSQTAATSDQPAPPAHDKGVRND